MRLVKVFVVSGALQTCFMPCSRMKVFERKDRDLFTTVVRHVWLLFRVMNHQNKKDR